MAGEQAAGHAAHGEEHAADSHRLADLQEQDDAHSSAVGPPGEDDSEAQQLPQFSKISPLIPDRHGAAFLRALPGVFPNQESVMVRA
ncbi:hypothetical protein GCM10010151_08040 [Actinoallomurus spadix]|uniref:Uncharacterized protein n=1 Tax=Actinoallomurus spadix TaxID=79912 RepID=A0ABP3FNQ3_9ACTN